MNTKLTLRLEENLIKAAKRHAGILGKSVSQMVADYFYLLENDSMDKKQPITPLVSSMKILFDTNVVLDVMLDRESFAEPASKLMSFVEKGKISGLLCATTMTTIHYLSAKVLGSAKAQNQIKTLILLFEIAPVNGTVIEDALISTFPDFEDAVLYQAACHAGARAIVTRDLKGFKRSELPIYSPDEMLAALQLSPAQK